MTIFDKALITIVVCDAVFALLALPLMLRKVPPNLVYGYRTRATLTDENVWYEANAHFGRGFLIASAITGIAAFALYRMRPAEHFLPLSLVVLTLPAAIATLATALYIRRLRAFTARDSTK